MLDLPLSTIPDSLSSGPIDFGIADGSNSASKGSDPTEPTSAAVDPPCTIAGCNNVEEAPPRTSARLNNLQSDSALDRAMRRKARLSEGDSSGIGISARKWTMKKIKSKSTLCGVNLSDAEATDLRKFIRANV